jgi:hypothetical protein
MNANKIIYLPQSHPSAISGQGKARKVLFLSLDVGEKTSFSSPAVSQRIQSTMNQEP